jgi:putative transposase
LNRSPPRTSRCWSTTSRPPARRARNRFAEHLAEFYSKPLSWHRAYFLVSAGGVTLETVRDYVQAQGTKEQKRSPTKRA